MAFRENAAGEIVMPADDGQWHVQQLCIFDLRNRTQSPQEIYGVQTASFRLTNFVPRTRARKKRIFHQHRPASLTPPSGVTLPPNRPAPSCFPKYAEGRHPHSLSACWRAVCDDAKLGKLRLHDLRRTAASHAVMSGENLPLVGKLLGHRRHRATAGHAHPCLACLTALGRRAPHRSGGEGGQGNC